MADTRIETLLRAAVDRLSNDAETPLRNAQISVLKAGLWELSDWKLDNLPSFTGPDRMFKIAPHGRAIVELAEAILQ